MNERIQELYLEAAEHMKTVQDQGLPAPYATRALAGKLAELIVQECCDVLYDNELGGYQVNYVLKEHFGVKS